MIAEDIHLVTIPSSFDEGGCMPRTWIFACMLIPVLNQAYAQQDNESSEPPSLSLEFLEFLSDFGSVDESSYEIIEYHAEQDLAKTKSKLENRETKDEK
jgi:hypothetical protein